MAEYHRILSYLYRYEKKQKLDCKGFVKAEQKNDGLKLTIQISDDRLMENTSLAFCFYAKKGKEWRLIPMDTLPASRHQEENIVFYTTGQLPEGFDVRNQYGVLLFYEKASLFSYENFPYYGSVWIGNEIPVVELLREKEGSQKYTETEEKMKTGEPEGIPYENKEPEETAGENEEPEGMSGKNKEPEEAAGENEKSEKASDENKEPEEAAGENKEPEGIPYENKKPEEAAGANKEPEGMPGENKEPEEAAGENEKPEKASDENKKPEEAAGEDKEPEGIPYENKKPEEAAGEDKEPEGMPDESYKPENKKPGKETRYNQGGENREGKTQNSENQRDDNKKEDICGERELRELSTKENISLGKMWIKLQNAMEPVDNIFNGAFREGFRIQAEQIDLLCPEEKNLGSNQFLLNGYRIYGYLLAGKVRYGGEDRFCIGVPGIYGNREKYMAQLYQFPVFLPTTENRIKTGGFGYWLRLLEESADGHR